MCLKAQQCSSRRGRPVPEPPPPVLILEGPSICYFSIPMVVGGGSACFGLLCPGAFCGCINKHTFFILTKPLCFWLSDWFGFPPSSTEWDTTSGTQNRLFPLLPEVGVLQLSRRMPSLLQRGPPRTLASAGGKQGWSGGACGWERGGAGSQQRAPEQHGCLGRAPCLSGAPPVLDRHGRAMRGGVALAGKTRDVFARK